VPLGHSFRWLLFGLAVRLRHWIAFGAFPLIAGGVLHRRRSPVSLLEGPGWPSRDRRVPARAVGEHRAKRPVMIRDGPGRFLAMASVRSRTSFAFAVLRPTAGLRSSPGTVNIASPPIRRVPETPRPRDQLLVRRARDSRARAGWRPRAGPPLGGASSGCFGPGHHRPGRATATCCPARRSAHPKAATSPHPRPANRLRADPTCWPGCGSIRHDRRTRRLFRNSIWSAA